MIAVGLILHELSVNFCISSSVINLSFKLLWHFSLHFASLITKYCYYYKTANVPIQSPTGPLRLFLADHRIARQSLLLISLLQITLDSS